MIAAGFGYHPAASLPLTWTWDPLPTLTLGALGLAYARGCWRLWRAAGLGHGLSLGNAGCFALGLGTALVALVSPLDALSDVLFSAHMSQHELLMVVAAPLVVLGRPLTAYVWALPQQGRVKAAGWVRRPSTRYFWQFSSAPLFVLVLHAVVRWIWHLPSLFEAAMRHEALHAFQHLTFFSTAALFWWAIVHGRYGKAGYGLAVLFVFATAVHTSVLGALISLAPRVIYGIYSQRVEAVGWNALADQELAGLLMWVPGGLLFLLCALALFAAWLGEAERRAARSAQGSTAHPTQEQTT